MSRDLQRRLGRLETHGGGAAAWPVVGYGPDEGPDDAVRRVFGARSLPPAIVLIPDNGRDPDNTFPPKDDRHDHSTRIPTGSGRR